MQTLTLPSAINVTVTPAVVVNTTSLILIKLYDDGSKVEADVQIGSQNRKRITLWDSTTTPTYASVGDWTQAQANARIIAVFEAGATA